MRRRTLAGAVAVGALALVAAALPLAAARAAGDSSRWLTTWAPSSTVASKGDPLVTNVFAAQQADEQSVRSIVTVTSPGDKLRLRFDNRFGTRAVRFGPVRVGLQAAGPALAGGSNRQVWFGGQPGVTIPVGREIVSDPVAFSLQAGDTIAVSIHVVGLSGPVTWHKIAHGVSYVSKPGSGDQTADYAGLGYATTAQSWFWMVGVDQQSSFQGTIVALGDSITDGYPIILGQQHTWPGILATRLAAAAPTVRHAVVNAGIGGNRLTGVICAECGPAALDRLDHDVLDLPHVTHVIVFEGTNDLGSGASAAQVISALDQVVTKAHQRGIKVIGATITPRADAIWNATTMEPARLTVNRWIRTAGAFDGVIDFDAVLRDPVNRHQLATAFDSGDHVHPSPLGYEALGDAVNLSFFA